MLRSTRPGSGVPAVLLVPGPLCPRCPWERGRPSTGSFHDALDPQRRRVPRAVSGPVADEIEQAS